MAKWYGKIGYAENVETRPGIWEDKITERNYYGDVLQTSPGTQSASDQVNDDIEVTNRISILADPFANQNFYSMRYLSYMGAVWKIKRVDVQYPRLILTVGGVYNGPQAETA